MLLQHASIYDVIPEDTLRALKAAIQAKEKPKMPSTALLSNSRSSASQEDRFALNTFEMAYNNCDWSSCSAIAQERRYDSAQFAELTRIKSIISFALGDCHDEYSTVLSRLIGFLNKIPCIWRLVCCNGWLKDDSLSI